MTIKTLVAAIAAACALPSFAAISPGTTQSAGNAAYSGNGELFLSVFDDSAKLSYTLDLGVTQNDFFTAAQADTGYTRSWGVNDANWSTFLGQVSTANLRWSVLAIDQTGGTAKGGVRLFATLQNGDEANLAATTNQLFSLGMGSTQAGTFFNAVNVTGTHGVSGQPLDFTVNGSSVNADADPGNSYYGTGSTGLSPSLNGNGTFDMSNPVGTASAFYYVTRSGATQLDTVAIDPFNNVHGSGSFLLAAANTASPGYVLSYAVPVPEPGSVAMLAAGLAVVGALVRRRRAD